MRLQLLMVSASGVEAVMICWQRSEFILLLMILFIAYRIASKVPISGLVRARFVGEVL